MSSNVKLPEAETQEKASRTTNHPHMRAAGRKLNHIVHPSGKKIHVAASPEEAERLKRTLSELPQTDDDEGFDIVLHGSPEHVSTLKDVHDHYDSQREAFRREHGPIWADFERVQMELDNLSSELQDITDHAVELDANFSKFGYSAHIRTHDHTPTHSSNNSLRSSSTDLSANARDNGSAMKLFVKPICRQYFHKGLIWRAHEPEETTSYELFLDLFYVGIIAISGDAASESAALGDKTGEALLRFVITFVLAWRLWTDVTVFMNWFDCDDLVRRLTVLFVLTCLLGYTTNIVEFLGDTYIPGVSFYLTARLFNAAIFGWYAYLVPMVRPALLGCVFNIVLPSTLWIGSIYVDYPLRYVLIWLAIGLDVTSSLLFIFIKKGTIFWGAFKDRLQKFFEFYPAINIEHRIDRTGAFVSLVFGYSVVSLLYQSKADIGINAYFGKAVLGLIMAFSFNWLYFEIDSYNLHTHAIRRHAVSSLLWFTMHLPFTLSYVLAGAALARIVLLHDTPESHLDDIAEFSVSRSEEEFSQGLRWFFCAGIGLALLCMTVISLTHVYKTVRKADSTTPKWLEKPVRLAVRSAVGVIIIGLGAVQSLNSLELIAITTCLIVFALAVELIGHLVVCGVPWCRMERKCAYGAKCHISKKDLEAHVKKGEIVRVEDLQGEKGAFNLT